MLGAGYSAQADSPKTTAHWVNGDVRRAVIAALLAACAITVYTVRLGGKDLWSAAEGHSPWMARAMLAGGSLVATADAMDGNLAPVHAWLVAGSFWLTGNQSEWAARLPSVLAALATLWIVYRFGRYTQREAVGRTAAMLCGLSVLFVWEARLAEAEMLLCLWVVAANTALFKAIHGRPWQFAWFHFCAGLAFATKGTLGLILVLGPALAFLLWQGEIRKVFGHKEFWISVPLLAFVSQAWNTYLAAVLGTQHLGNIVAIDRTGHDVPYYYYLLRLPLSFLPLTVFLPWALAIPWRWRRENNARRTDALAAARLCFCWFSVSLVLLMLWPSKQTSNLLPLVPALSLLAAQALEQVGTVHGFWAIDLRESFAKLGVWLVPACCTVGAPIVAAMGYATGAWVLLLVAAGLTMASLAVRLAAHWSRRFGFEVVLAELLVVMSVVIGFLVPAFDSQKSHKPFLETVERLVPTQERLATLQLGPHDLFYLQRELDVLHDPADWQGQRTPYLLAPRRRLRQWLSDSYTVVARSGRVGNDDLVLVQAVKLASNVDRTRQQMR